MIEVPSVSGEAFADWVNDRVLQDIDGTGEVGGEEALGPPGEAVGLGEEAASAELMICSHLPEHNVLREDMSAASQTYGHQKSTLRNVPLLV